MSIAWVAMLVSGVLWAVCTEGPGSVAGVAFSSAKEAVQLSLALAGSIGLWSGMARIAEQSGLTTALAARLRPIIGPLFPGLARKSKSIPLIASSMVANLLGLGMAATPLGLRAMQQLAIEGNSRSHTHPSRAGSAKQPSREPTDAMCTFAIVTASSLTLVPTTIISLRAEMGSKDPTAVVGATILATSCSTAAAVLVDRLFRKGRRKR